MKILRHCASLPETTVSDLVKLNGSNGFLLNPDFNCLKR